MITTLTFNPSIDRTANVDRLRVGEVNQVLDSSVEPGGKGINIARAVATNGLDATAIFPGDATWLGEVTAELQAVGVACRVVERASATRSNLTVTDRDGTTTKLNEIGPAVEGEVLDALLDAAVDAEADGPVAVAGSIGGGTDPAVYAEVAKRLNTPEHNLAVDTSGPALAAMVGVPCRVAKPNVFELQSLVDQPLRSFGEVGDVAGELRSTGWDAVLVSLGPDGALLVDRDGLHHGTAQVDTVRNTVGAGDALLAGFLAAGANGREALAEALAWAHAAVSSPGTAAPPVTDRDRAAVALSQQVDLETRLTETA